MKRKALAMLIGLCLLTGCAADPIPGFGTEKPTAVQQQLTTLEFSDRYARTNGYHEGVDYPRVAVLDSVAAVEEYDRANKEAYDLEAKIQTGTGIDRDLGFWNICAGYDAAFFRESYVVLILLEEPSGSIRHKVTAASQYEDGRVGIAVERIVPEAGTDDMAQWHIFVELSREAMVADAGAVRVYLDGVLAWNGGYVEPVGTVANNAEPPNAILNTPEGEFALRPQGYHWFYPTSHSTEAGAIADQIDRPVPKAYLEPIAIGSSFGEQVEAYICPGSTPDRGVGYLVKLNWEIPPTSVQYTCWQNGEGMERSVESLGTGGFYALQGDYVYEIVAHWDGVEGECRGSANYYAYILGGEDHGHQVAQTAQTVDTPITGYCGNTWTTLHIGDEKYQFMFGNSVTLTDILVNLDYDPMKVCRCKPEYTVDTEFGTGYGINLTQGYARCEKGQADLTQTQIECIEKIIHWAQTTNCEYIAD